MIPDDPLPTPTSATSSGLDKLGKYEIVRELGRGSMGIVYLGYDPFANRSVAIKVANPRKIEGKSGDRFKKLFFNEARAAGLLDHPSIVRVFDADASDEGLCYLVMEYIEKARTLETFCDPDHLLPLREVVSLIYKAAKALDYAHRQGVIHRDIKPGNILYNEDKEVKLLDFGVAMINRPDHQETQFIGFMGSPSYMSPEQITDGGICSNTDIFSLGIVFYYLLTGFHPFRAGSLPGVAMKITKEEPPALHLFRKDLPDGLSYVLRRMLRKQAKDRYKMGVDLAADLSVIFDDLDRNEREDSLEAKFNAVRNLGFFKGLCDQDIMELVRSASWQNYRANTPIIREGETGDWFYILLSGVVSIEKTGKHIDNLQAGDCFGEMAFFSNIHRTASVHALTEVTVIKVNAATVTRAAEDTQLRFLRVFTQVLIQRLATTTSSYAAFCEPELPHLSPTDRTASPFGGTSSPLAGTSSPSAPLAGTAAPPVGEETIAPYSHAFPGTPT
jgi:serine/threonine protein kinase